MEPREEGKAEKALKDLGQKLDKFAVEAREAGVRVEADLRKKYEELKSSADKLKSEATSKDRWKEVEAALKKAGEELDRAAKAAFSKRDKPGAGN